MRPNDGSVIIPVFFANQSQAAMLTEIVNSNSGLEVAHFTAGRVFPDTTAVNYI